VKTGLSVTATPVSLPDAAALAALRGWHEGLSSKDAVTRYVSEARAPGQSSRGLIGAIRRDIAAFARLRHHDDLAKLFTGPARKGPAAARAVAAAVEQLRSAAVPVPLIGDEVDDWLEPRVAAVLRKAGIKTLADLTLRVPRRRRWWVGINGLGVAGARRIADPGSEFAVHSWADEDGREAKDYPADAPENRAYIDYYKAMGMPEGEAKAFYAMTNSVPHADAKWLTAADMGRWVKLN